MQQDAIKINAIVVRSKESGENDRTLTLLSPEVGKITVMAKGVKSLRHKSRSSCFPLSYSSFVLKKIKDNLYSLTSADLIESFRPLCEDVLLLSYGAYFADLCSMCVQSGTEADEEVRLLLNTLYVLSKRADDAPYIKTVFELRMAELCGIVPEFSYECPCGRKGMFFSPSDAQILCDAHKTPDALAITQEEISVLLYILENPLKDALFAKCDTSAAISTGRITEAFLRYHLSILPPSLDYLHQITKKL